MLSPSAPFPSLCVFNTVFSMCIRKGSSAIECMGTVGKTEWQCQKKIVAVGWLIVHF